MLPKHRNFAFLQIAVLNLFRLRPNKQQTRRQHNNLMLVFSHLNGNIWPKKRTANKCC